MAELSHRPLRELLENFGGCDFFFTEMISASAFCAGGPFEEWYADAGPKPEKTVYQLVGSEPEKLAAAAFLLDQRECAGIDINMGCSAPAITRTGAGVRWMESPDRAASMISLVRKSVKRRLSVKLRIGLKDDFPYLINFCKRLEGEGVEMITLHPRTAKEKFRRNCRWDYIPALRRELKIPVTGNGDISSAEEMIRRGEQCDAVMIGRLAVRQPWVFARAKELVREEVHAEAQRRGGAEVGKEKKEEEEEGEKRDFSGRFRAEAQGRRGAEVGKGKNEEEEEREEEREVEEEKRKGKEKEEERLVLETWVKFLELLACYQPAEFHISRARRFFHYFCDNLKWGNFLKNQLNREPDLAGIERVWMDYFSEHKGEV